VAVTPERTAATPAPATAIPAATAGTGTVDSAGLVPAPEGDAGPAPELVDLVNADGTPFHLSDLSGSPTLLFFGYTHCPDVCPATIGELFGVFEARPDVRAVFVSVDPERDTVDFLARWTQYFPDNFKAVTGSPGAIRRAADDYGVKYARVETSSTIGYTMSHTADVYLIDPDGRLLWSYPFGTPSDQMVQDLARFNAG
jgi:protein SCO1/2